MDRRPTCRATLFEGIHAASCGRLGRSGDGCSRKRTPDPSRLGGAPRMTDLARTFSGVAPTVPTRVTRAAVLREIGGPSPFADSRPLIIEELELAPPGPDEVL